MTAPSASFLMLPGFLPDALPFAARTALSLLLAYLVSFAIQIQSPSTAGICVALIAQPSAGMAFSKAAYRVLGTVLGGVAALLLIEAFPQDRTMLLAGYALWLGLCAFVAALLRDFRSYGAALSGYTAGVIAIAAIDAPETALIVALDRVAAILIGVLSVLVVNNAFAGAGAFEALVKALHERNTRITALAVDALEERPAPDDLTLIRDANGVTALQTQAVYAAAELPDGQVRSNGARHVIAALLATLSISRAISRTEARDASPATRTHLEAVAAALRGGPTPPPAPPPTHPIDALLLECADDLIDFRAKASAGLRTLSEGAGLLPRISVAVSYDIPGALLGALRTIIAIGLCATFTVLAGWSGATLVLIQSSAIIALLGTMPNPSKASVPFLFPILPMALLVGFAKFVALAAASGFVPFALTIGPLAFAVALMVRQPRLAPYAPPTLLFLTLFLSPANPQTFDLTSFCNTVLEVCLALLFVLLAFRLILPVSPTRSLYRVAAQIGRNLRWTLRNDRRRFQRGPALSVLYDRMSRALLWLGRPTPARQRLLSHLYGMGEMDIAVRRARTGLAATAALEPALSEAVAVARRSLQKSDAASILQSAQELLDGQAGSLAVRQAVSGMAAAALLLQRDPGLLRFYRRFVS